MMHSSYLSLMHHAIVIDDSVGSTTGHHGAGKGAFVVGHGVALCTACTSRVHKISCGHHAIVTADSYVSDVAKLQRVHASLAS